LLLDVYKKYVKLPIYIYILIIKILSIKTCHTQFKAIKLICIFISSLYYINNIKK